MPSVSPLLAGDKHVTDIKTKGNIFNEHFAEQCTLLRNNSVLPINQASSGTSQELGLE